MGFGEDHDGEFYLLDHTAGTIHRLVPNPRPAQKSGFPRRLSESGLFSSAAELVPAAGVVPYSINAEPWADHAVAERLVAVPNELSIRAADANWTFPPDSVLVKTMSLDMQHGNPASRRRVETQILHFDGSEWQPYTYRWNDEQTDALLVDAAGAEQTFEIIDPDAAGGIRKQTWRFSGRAECQRCHNNWSGPALAFNTPQLNRQHLYGGTSAPQLDTLAHIGLLRELPAADRRPQLADPSDMSAALDRRARAYLQANCAHCHRMHAGGSVLSKMHYDLPLEETDMVGARPTQGTFGIHAAQVIAPGDPFRSVLLYRMSKLGGGRMPHIGSTEVDRAGVQLISDWIRQMPKTASSDNPGDEVAAQLRRAERATLQRLHNTDEAAAEQIELVERLLSSTSGALLLLQSVDRQTLPSNAISLAIERATGHKDVSIRDLFERFLPPENRTQRLGSVVETEQLLALPGDVSRGREVFFATAGVQCKNCHRIQNEGQELGPELTKIGAKYDRARLLESILEPSKLIDPKYVTYLVETTDGRLLNGLLVKKDAREVVVKDAQNEMVRVAAEEIEKLVPQQRSLMPELLLRDMTAQQVADLLTFLSALK